MNGRISLDDNAPRKVQNRKALCRISSAQLREYIGLIAQRILVGDQALYF